MAAIKFVKSILYYVIATIFIQLLILYRDLLVAKNIGLNDDLDSWVLIYTGITFVVSLFLGSTIGYLVPELQQFLVKKEFPLEEIKKIKTKVFKVVLALSIFLVIFQMISIKKISIDKKAVMILIGLLVILFNVYANFIRAIIQAMHLANIVSFSPLISLCVSLSVFIILQEKIGVVSLALGLGIGLLAEAIVLRQYLYSHLKSYSVVKSSLNNMTSYWSLVLAGAVTAMSTLIDQFMISNMLNQGNAAFSYGGKISSAFIGFAGGMLSVIIFPKLSRIYVENKQQLKLHKYIFIVFGLNCLFSLVLYFLARPVFELLILGGKFSLKNVEEVISVHQYLVWQIPFYLTGSLGLQMLQIEGRGKSVFKIALVGLIMKTTFNFIFSEKYGVNGFAISTVIFYFITTTLIWISVYKSNVRRVVLK